MKIFVTVLLLPTMAILCRADISLNTNSGYNYQAQQALFAQQQPLIMQVLSGQHTQLQQGQAQAQLPIQLPFPQQPSNQYLPSPVHNFAAALSLPMPVSFPATNSNFITVPAPKMGGIRRSRPRVKIPKKPIVTKNFFIHAAPEESDEEIQEELSQLAQQPRKHYNVLFVKTPAQTSKAAAVNLAKALKEEKTVVYVLSKKTSATDLQDAIAEAPQHINKPEVFFIKYRTPEEAANAQRQIQSQYDSLGGTTTITDEGLAPITSVVGSLDAPEEDEVEDDIQQQQHQLHQQEEQRYDEQLVNNINSMGNQYLPPAAGVQQQF